MPYVLPKEAKTQKLESLPSDLRKLADELIGEKFKVEEVVERKSRPSFREEATGFTSFTGISEFPDRKSARGISSWDDVYSRQRILRVEIGEPTLSAIMEAVHELKMRARIRDTDIVMYTFREFYRFMQRDRELGIYISQNVEGSWPRIFGMDIRESRDGVTYLEARVPHERLY